MKAYAGLEKMLSTHKAKLVLDLHLDPNHKAFMLFEAPSAEAVRDVVMMSGLGSFLDCDFHLVTSIPDTLKLLGNFPILYP